MSGMKKIAGAIALTSLILWGGAVSTVAKVFAQSQTTGGFEFVKLYAFRGRDAPAQDCTPDGPSLSDQVAVLCLA